MLRSVGYTVDQVTSDEVTDQVADFKQMVGRTVAAIVYEPLSPSAGKVLSAIVLTIPLVTYAKVAQWYRSSMTTSSTASAGAPAGLDVPPNSELAGVLG
jgi:hypothetical protein